MRAARASLKVHPAIAASVIVLCLTLIFGLLWQIHVVVTEVFALIAMGLAFRYWPPMKLWFLRMPIAHRIAFGLIFAGMLAGHFTLDTRRFFPFITWEIFPTVREEDPVTCREFMATTASGKSVRLLTEQLFPSIIQFNPPGDNGSTEMAALVRSLARAYDRAHVADPVRRVDLERMSVKLHPTGGEAALFSTCELLKSYDVSLDR